MAEKVAWGLCERIKNKPIKSNDKFLEIAVRPSMLYPIPPAQNGEIYNSKKVNAGATGKYQLQWADDYIVITTNEKDGRAYKSIYIGSIAVEGGQWDLGNSNVTHEARFEYRPNAEKEISMGGCETPTPYDPDFICDTPFQPPRKANPPSLVFFTKIQNGQ